MKIYSMIFKRIIDITISFLTIITLVPLFLIIAIIIRVDLGSPIIFSQKRPGKNETIFKLYKFRSMTDQRDIDGNLLPDSQRLTKFGKFLRSSSLDELPELWNILKGDMAIVGPRPLLRRYLPYYSEEERVRHFVRPGLTGLAQTNGRNNLGWDDRLKFDIEYVNNISFVLDLKIMLNTIVKVLKKEDILIVDQGKLKSLDVERGSQVGTKISKYK